MARAIVLAAGFGTRMGELGRRCPKGLLDLGMGVVMDPILSDLESSAAVESIVWVTNGRFAEMYRQWLTAPLAHSQVLIDGVTELENRLGAIGDLTWHSMRLATRAPGVGPTTSTLRCNRRTPEMEARLQRRGVARGESRAAQA